MLELDPILNPCIFDKPDDRNDEFKKHFLSTKRAKWKVQAKLLSKRIIQNSREHMSQLIVSGVTQYLYNYSPPRHWKKLSNRLHREDKTDLVLFHLRNRSLCHKKHIKHGESGTVCKKPHRCKRCSTFEYCGCLLQTDRKAVGCAL